MHFSPLWSGKCPSPPRWFMTVRHPCGLTEAAHPAAPGTGRAPVIAPAAPWLSGGTAAFSAKHVAPAAGTGRAPITVAAAKSRPSPCGLTEAAHPAAPGTGRVPSSLQQHHGCPAALQAARQHPVLQRHGPAVPQFPGCGVVQMVKQRAVEGAAAVQVQGNDGPVLRE